MFHALGAQLERREGAWSLWKHTLLLLKGLKLIYIQHHQNTITSGTDNSDQKVTRTMKDWGINQSLGYIYEGKQ